MAVNMGSQMAGAASRVTSAGGFEECVAVARDWPGLPAEYCEARWYAAYTSANHERSVAAQLCVRKVEHFLPTYSSLRRWKDRRVTLQLPLFPGYVFVRVALRNRLQVLQIPGVACLVGFHGSPAALPDEEIEALRAGFTSGVRAEPHPYLITGRRVRVKNGPLKGLEGTVVRRKNTKRFVISLELIERSIRFDVSGLELELAPIQAIRTAPFSADA